MLLENVIQILPVQHLRSVSYDFKKTTFTVRIMRATQLPAKDFSGTSDPYVKVSKLLIG